MKKKVSCHIITYNQIDYISKCIDGIVMQEVNFPIEIIIGDDNSTDGTRELLIEYANKYPNLIKLNLREVRGLGLPGKQNFMTTLAMCSGEFIALCDGDDYWTDPLKLQKQVDFLEANPDFVIHSANAMQLSTDAEFNNKPLFSDTTASVFELNDFLSNNNLVTCTALFRNSEFQLPDFFNEVNFGDWFIYVILMKNSGLKAYRSPDFFSVYRVHDKGVMNTLGKLNYYNTHIIQIITIHNYLGNKKFNAKEIDALNYYFLQKYKLVLKNKSYFKALTTFMTNFKYSKTKMPFSNYLREIKHHIS